MHVGACGRRLAAAPVVLASILSSWAAGSSAASSSSAPVSAVGSPCASGSPGYDVRSGDGWFSIAERAEVSVRSLLDANGAALEDGLHPGDRLCLPAGSNLLAVCPATATVRSGDGWGVIAQRAGAAMSAVLAANGADEHQVLHPGDVVCLPAGEVASSGAPATAGGAGGDYTVVRGDSWFRIAERAGVSVRALLDANGASSDEVLLPGRSVRLPAGATTPAPRSATVSLAARPVQGPCWYSDSWGHQRSGGRRHVGVDLFTVPGQYVYAVADGRLSLRRWAQPGNISGNAWRLTADDGNDYFYAHLSDFAPDLRTGSRVRAGQIIGWVGKTGNTTVEHLHFEIRPGRGSPVNPYPILQAQGGGCNTGTPYTQPGGWVPDRRG